VVVFPSFLGRRARGGQARRGLKTENEEENLRVCLTCTRVVAAIAIALILASSCEARFWRNRGASQTCYYQYAGPAPTQAAASPTAPNTPVTRSIPASPTINPVAHEIVAPAPAAATSENAASEVYVSPAPVAQPSYGNTGGWSVLPSRASDYGRFPPYYH
jgi:hypothetical protein